MLVCVYDQMNARRKIGDRNHAGWAGLAEGEGERNGEVVEAAEGAWGWIAIVVAVAAGVVVVVVVALAG